MLSAFGKRSPLDSAYDCTCISKSSQRPHSISLKPLCINEEHSWTQTQYITHFILSCAASSSLFTLCVIICPGWSAYKQTVETDRCPQIGCQGVSAASLVTTCSIFFYSSRVAESATTNLMRFRNQTQKHQPTANKNLKLSTGISIVRCFDQLIKPWSTLLLSGILWWFAHLITFHLRWNSTGKKNDMTRVICEQGNACKLHRATMYIYCQTPTI